MKAENFKLQYTRLANLKDVENIMAIAKSQVAVSGFSGIPIDEKRMRVMIETSIIETPKNHCMLVSVDEKDKAVGYIACFKFNPPFSLEEVGLELGWFCKPDAKDYKKRMLELRSAYEEWCRRNGIRHAQYAIMNPTEKDISELNKNSRTTVLELVYHRDVTVGQEE